MTPDRRVKQEHRANSSAGAESDQDAGESGSADIETILERNRS